MQIRFPGFVELGRNGVFHPIERVTLAQLRGVVKRETDPRVRREFERLVRLADNAGVPDRARVIPALQKRMCSTVYFGPEQLEAERKERRRELRQQRKQTNKRG